MAVKVKQHKGAWWIFIDHHNKRKAKRIGSSKRAAEIAAEKIQARIALGQFEIKDEKQRRPFDTHFQTWLDTYVKAHCKERTYELYEAGFRLYLRPAFGQKDITAITREEVKRLAYGLLAQGKSRLTAKGVLTPLSGMFSMAVEDGHVTSNPAFRILKRSRAAEGKQQERLQPLTREEVSLLLEACRAYYPGHYALVLLLVRAGLRIGEALALRWGDVDFNGRFAEVRQTWSNGRLTITKGNRRRRVDLSLHLTETLKALLVERKKETLRKGWGEVPEWVSTSQRGTRLTRGNFYDWVWVKLLRKAGLRQVRIHDLRHTYASLLIQNGAPLAYVKDQLGHSSIQITVDTYGHLVPGGNRSEVDRLDDPVPATIRNLAATTLYKAEG
jgi:integrase